MEKYLTGENVLMFCLVALMICWGFNLIYAAIQNARKEKEHAREPFNRIDTTFKDIRSRMDAHEREINSRMTEVERRMVEHETDLKDIHTGQSAMLRGVQALLDHELHNGNEEEMKAASDSIGKWLRTR